MFVRSFWLPASLAIVSACDKSDRGHDQGATKAVEPAAVAPSVVAVIEIERDIGTKATTVSMPLPTGWHADESFPSRWTPGSDPFQVGLTAHANCGGSCDANSIAGNIAAAIGEDLVAMYTQGSEPHLRPTVQVIEEGELPLGRYQAFRLTYPPAPAGSASGRGGTHLDCYLHEPDVDFYVKLEARATPDQEAQIWPTILESCREATFMVKD